MRDRRAKFSDRRRNDGNPAYPFRDRHDSLVTGCRRQVAAERRKDSLQAAMFALGSLDHRKGTRTT